MLTALLLLALGPPPPPPPPPTNKPVPQPAEAPSTPAAAPPPEAPEPAAEAPTPEPVAPAAGPAADPAELQRLIDEAKTLRDELFQARAKAAVLSATLFKTRIELEVAGNLERFWEATDFVIMLDGAPVYGKQGAMPPPGAKLFTAHAAPGTHEIAISAALVARRDRSLKLRIDQSFTVSVDAGHVVLAKLSLRENGNPWNLAKRRRAVYRVRADLKLRAKKDKKLAASVKAGARAGGGK